MTAVNMGDEGVGTSTDSIMTAAQHCMQLWKLSSEELRSSAMLIGLYEWRAQGRSTPGSKEQYCMLWECFLP